VVVLQSRDASINLTFGQIMFLGGDYYAVPSSPVCFSANDSEARQRFLEAFNTLAAGDVKELGAIVEYIADTRRNLTEAMAGGESAHSFYDSIQTKMNIDLNRLTGGGSPASPYFPEGRFLRISSANFDHFDDGNCSMRTYKVGHQLAMDTARAPGATVAQKLQAYAYEAFALHFFSDAFAAGHMRTPRLAMRKHIDVVGISDLLGSYMHDEENRLGLNVTNDRGDQWVSFGDDCLFDGGSARNRELALEAVQLSVSGVEGARPWDALELVPRPDPSRPSITPMFSWDGTALVRRSYLNDPWRREVSTYWTGSGTLAELYSTYKAPKDMPPQEPPQTSASMLFA